MSFFTQQGLCQVPTLYSSENPCLSSWVMSTLNWCGRCYKQKGTPKARKMELYLKLRTSICGNIDDFVALNIPIGGIPSCCQCGEGGIWDTESSNTTKRHWKVTVTHQDIGKHWVIWTLTKWVTFKCFSIIIHINIKGQFPKIIQDCENWGETMTWNSQVFPLSDWRRPSVAG